MFPRQQIAYETVDVLQGGTHQADVLNWSSFHKSKKDAYDMVWLPDCGGLWFDMFTMFDKQDGPDETLLKVYKEEAILRLTRITLCQLRLLKSGGRLYLGKILIEPDLFAALVLSLLNKADIDTAVPLVEQPDHHGLQKPDRGGPFIVLTKK